MSTEEGSDDHVRLGGVSTERQVTCESEPLLFPPGFVHLHPTRACNLECLHCYSSSSPRAQVELATDDCLNAIRALAGYGYTQLNLSGGEPTLHAGFDEIVSIASELGMRVSVITNGWRSSPAIIDRLSRCDTVAVSIDGPRIVHDHLRQRQGSFDAALRTVAELSARDRSVGIVSCVTESTIDFIPELWEIAASLGAALLQFRPIAPVGRAAEHHGLSSPLLDRLAVVAAALGSVGGGPRVQCDLIGTQHLLRGITSLIEEFRIGEMTQLLSPLVIDERGSLRPYSYNLSGHDLGTIGSLRDGSFRTAFERWRSDAIGLHERTAAATSVSDSNFVDWFELLVRVSQQSAMPVSVQMPGL